MWKFLGFVCTSDYHFHVFIDQYTQPIYQTFGICFWVQSLPSPSDACYASHTLSFSFSISPSMCVCVRACLENVVDTECHQDKYTSAKGKKWETDWKAVRWRRRRKQGKRNWTVRMPPTWLFGSRFLTIYRFVCLSIRFHDLLALNQMHIVQNSTHTQSEHKYKFRGSYYL